MLDTSLLTSNNSLNILNYVSDGIDNLILYLKNKKNKNIYWIINILKIIKKNIKIISVFFAGLCLYFSSQIIGIIYMFLLFDSIIISILILQNNLLKSHARRLAKNIISLFLLTLNLTGTFSTLVTVSFIYFEFNKFINSFIFKIIESLITFLSSTIPFISYLYPNVKLIDHKKPIESTEKTYSDSDSSSESGSESDSDSDSNSNSKHKLKKNNSTISGIIYQKKNNKEHKMYKKIIKKLE